MGFGKTAQVVLATAALLLQWLLGANRREFISDESAHYITAVAVRDLILGGHLLHPIRFLTDFYVHYQFLGIGLWPPGYHLSMAAWGAVFSLERSSIMAFVACLVVALVTTTVLAGRRSLGSCLAVLTGVAVLLAPPMLGALNQLLADLPVALFMLLAALAFGRILESGRVRDGLLFGIAALAGVMTKGNALALCLLPPLAVLLTRRWNLFLRSAFWVPALVVLPIAVPWYALTYSWASAGFRYAWGLEYLRAASLFIVQQWISDFGPALLLLAMLGAVQVLRRGSVQPALTGCGKTTERLLFPEFLAAGAG
jgi:4-amino-4-deoxy-L-arabinose transferase-like glycosyltransferase